MNNWQKKIYSQHKRQGGGVSITNIMDIQQRFLALSGYLEALKDNHATAGYGNRLFSYYMPNLEEEINIALDDLVNPQTAGEEA